MLSRLFGRLSSAMGEQRSVRRCTRTRSRITREGLVATVGVLSCVFNLRNRPVISAPELWCTGNQNSALCGCVRSAERASQARPKAAGRDSR